MPNGWSGLLGWLAELRDDEGHREECSENDLAGTGRDSSCKSPTNCWMELSVPWLGGGLEDAGGRENVSEGAGVGRNSGLPWAN